MSRSQPPSPPGGSSRSLCKKACDSCRQRKIKCDIERDPEGIAAPPCKPCAASKLSCTFNKPVLPKGPKPGASRLRHNDARQPERQRSNRDSLGTVSRESRQDDLVTPDLVRFYLEYYFHNIYSGFPILTDAIALHLEEHSQDNDGVYVLLCALMSFLTLTTAFTLNGSVILNATQNSGNLGLLFLDEAVRMRRNLDEPRGDAMLYSIMTSFLLSRTYLLQNDDERAYHTSQEAVPRFNSLLSRADPTVDLTRPYQLIFWILFVDHIMWSMRRDFIFTLSTASNLHPSLAQPLNADDIISFSHQTELFRAFDASILAQWRNAEDYRMPEFQELRTQLELALQHYLSHATSYLMPFEQSLQWASAMLLQIFSSHQSPNGRSTSSLVIPVPTLQQFVRTLQHIVDNYLGRQPPGTIASLRRFLHDFACSLSYLNNDVSQSMFSPIITASAGVPQALLTSTVQHAHTIAPALSSPTYIGSVQVPAAGSHYGPVISATSRRPSVLATNGLYYAEPIQQQGFLYSDFSQADTPGDFYDRHGQFNQGGPSRRHL